MSSAKVETPVAAQATSPSGPDSYELANVGKEDRSVGNDSSKADDEDKSLYQTPAQIRIERIRFATLCHSFFLLGWNDGSTGPLLPAIKGHYNVGFAAVSSLFIVTCAGAAVGAFSIFYLLDKLGFGKVLVIGAILQTIAYAVQAAAPPFPAFVVIAFINGMGMSFQDATGNGFVASLKRNGARKMGILHAVYGLGAFVAPFVATPFSSMKAKQWALFYITSAGIAAIAAVALSVVFRFKRQDVLLHETNSEIHKEEPSADGTVTVDGRNKMMHTLSLPLVHYLAFYIGVYVGVEVTLGGWVVTFIRDERGGNASSGYITSGFFGGLMAGRILLLPVNSWLGERRVIFLYAVLTIALDVVIWQVRSLIGDAVAVSIIGVLFGPMYPIVMHQAGLILPPRILAGAVGYIAGFGIVGAAIIPFITGALAARFEIRVMPIVVLIMTTMMAMLWALAMRQQKRSRID
ncbi:MFS general substrate transporter [Exidia glandulosa HHB12029]|uniref:MFS general substrate transporter n=1 Tax=Exidia glandulosa HHB12029 TaxID=1314781 RepID=A0A165LNX5_EXIGL|nr:MFS general substrate transporter [Exidia glandulosa HHB12029]